jgi:hypothetical protein
VPVHHGDHIGVVLQETLSGRLRVVLQLERDGRLEARFNRLSQHLLWIRVVTLLPLGHRQACLGRQAQANLVGIVELRSRLVIGQQILVLTGTGGASPFGSLICWLA